MSETVKLIIEISKKDYEWAKQIAQTRNESVYCERQIVTISNGIPLDDVKAEIENLTYYWCEVHPRSVIDDVLKILDNIGKESEEKPNEM